MKFNKNLWMAAAIAAGLFIICWSVYVAVQVHNMHAETQRLNTALHNHQGR